MSRQAQDDLRWVYYSTADTWGINQAEKYISLMKESFEILRDFPGIGSATILGENVLVYLFKVGGSRWSHGHKVFYRIHRDYDLFSESSTQGSS
ncbi:hypothetical protein CCB80_11800 [Armatimonadetes bacterium Uphvl-Ar1]|nr:hypothetical protein CCB80_11800 [Armatimonadetes bacterium Uphvl-Ar1]